jgi:8-oxo-dGTP pyrophosphatase MutT (NUDIX family)
MDPGRRGCLDALEGYRPRAEEAAAHGRWLELLRTTPDVTDRRSTRAHVTVSAVPLSPDGRRALLCRHPRYGRWGPWGGHVDPDDASAPAALVRELVEEAGDLGWRVGGVVALWEGPVRCLPGADVEHLDLLFAVTAAHDGPPLLAGEVTRGAWCEVGDLPEPSTPGLGELMALSAAHVRPDSATRRSVPK